MADTDLRLVSFAAVFERRQSRRGFLAAAGRTAALAGLGLAVAPPDARAAGSGATAGWRSLPRIAPSLADALQLAQGYHYDVVARWGDALWPGEPSMTGAALRAGALLEPDAAERQARRFGNNCDGIAYFPLEGRSSRRGLLCVNHEYVRSELALPGLPISWGKRAVALRALIASHAGVVPWLQAAHGVSVLQVERAARGPWRIREGGPFARRITANTPCEIMGPARGAALLRTAADPGGTRALGTFSNCAGGKTPWGTYLTAEENIDDYFGGARSWAAGSDDTSTIEAHRRFPLLEESPYAWEHGDPRFDLRRNPREPLRFGWMVEIDPRDPQSPPRKRTALGRFCHEGANTILARDGRVAAYMGDDEKFEYVYKFVTRDRFDPQNPAANRDLLDHGTLYVARFDADGGGAWLPLVHDENGPLNPASGLETRRTW